MRLITIDVVPDPHGSRAYVVEVKRGSEMLGFWEVNTAELAQTQVLKAIQAMLKTHNPDLV